jgi:hypothetical protein
MEKLWKQVHVREREWQKGRTEFDRDMGKRTARRMNIRTDRQTNRQLGRRTDRQIDVHIYRQWADGQDRKIDWQTDRHTHTQTHTHTRTERERDRERDKHTEGQTHRKMVHRQKEGWTDKQTYIRIQKDQQTLLDVRKDGHTKGRKDKRIKRQMDEHTKGWKDKR